MQSAASQQFLNHEKLPHFFYFSPGAFFFAPSSVGWCKQCSADACNGLGWEQGNDKVMMVKSSGVKALLNQGQILSKAGFCACICPFSLNPDFTVVARV